MKLSSPTGLVSVVVFMFAFGFMLVPLYDVICEVTGLNGKTAGQYEGEIAGDTSKNRDVKIQFLVNRNANLTWGFSPNTVEMKLPLGERRETSFRVVNTYRKDVVAQAIPSVAPAEAAPYLHKMECFCFQQQPLTAGETKDMPLVFFIDPELPDHITKLTLSYTLFDITDTVAKTKTEKPESKIVDHS